MLDPKILRHDAESVAAALRRRNARVNLAPLLALDERRREAVREYEAARRRSENPRSSALREYTRELRRRMRSLDAQWREALMLLPNPPLPHVPTHLSESERILREGGEAAAFPFDPKPHWQLGERLGLWDAAAGARCAGPRFVVFTAAGARLARGLVNFMLDVHTSQFGFEETRTPFIVRREALEHTGQMPGMESKMFSLSDGAYFLTPSGEVPLVNAFCESVFDSAALPQRRAACCTCFRKEVGAAGRRARGLVRLRQFDAVHLLSFCTPEQTAKEFHHL